jgi:hypothetical protein
MIGDPVTGDREDLFDDELALAPGHAPRMP